MTNRSMEPTVAEFLEAQMALSNKTQTKIAAELGYNKPNMITMFKQGVARLPLNKVGPMANALGVEPSYLLRLVMREYMPETLAAIEQLLPRAALTDHEKKVVEGYRALSKGRIEDVTLTIAERQITIKA